jgi:hypothetical protein
MDFYLFTKTVWNEPPRLRHQVAQLLASAGHEVLFFQKPGYAREGETQLLPHLTGVRTRYLMHAQLRATRTLSRLNAAVEKREIRRFAPRPPRIGVVNFNFDYEFLRDLYPQAKIVTVINDDFIDGAKPFSRAETIRVLGSTARMSDRNLVVSYPLLQQLRGFSERTDLFLPWSRSGYNPPAERRDRPDLLYWGYLNDRIDANAVLHVLNAGIRIHFVGPITPSPKMDSFLAHPNATYRASATLPELQGIIDRCAASILPYDLAFKQVAAITINNRAFELLSYGLPLLYSDLPGLIDAPRHVIYRCASPQGFVEAARDARGSFDASQPDIASFLENHTGEQRYEQLMGYFR